jgi:hypothetical protein
MTLGRTAERSVADERVEDDLARPDAKSEEPGPLLDEQAQARHFTIGPEDHRDQLFARRFRRNGVPAAQPAFRVFSRHSRGYSGRSIALVAGYHDSIGQSSR